MKKIELEDKIELELALMHYIIRPDVSNAGLISPAIARAIGKFMKELETIPLSEELRNSK